MTRALAWRWLGRVAHADALAEQEARRARLIAGDDDARLLLLCEHPPVITLGRSADRSHVLLTDDALARRGIELARTSRGGDVTYHGPGQLMVYPVVRLERGVVAYLEAIAAALAEVAAELGAPGAAWRRDPAGLWLAGSKLAACGIHVRRGVAVHGWALDVATPPEAWSAIVPCGIAGVRTVSIATASGRTPPPMPEVAALAAARVAAALGYVPASESTATMVAQP